MLRKSVAVIILFFFFATPVHATTMIWDYEELGSMDLNELTTIKNMNIDVVMNYNYAGLAYYAGQNWSLDVIEPTRAWLDALQAHGLKGMVNLTIQTYWMPTKPDITLIQQIVTALRYHPALYGWYTADEMTAAMQSLANRTAIYNTIKALDPYHPVFEASNPVSDPGLTGFQDSSLDIWAEDYYPYMLDGNDNGFSSTLSGIHSTLGTGSNSKLACAIQAGVFDQYGENVPEPGAITRMAATAASNGFAARLVGFFTWNTTPAYRAAHSNESYAIDYAYMQSEITSVSANYTSTIFIDTPVSNTVLTGTMTSGGTVTGLAGATFGTVTYPTSTTWSVPISGLSPGDNVIAMRVTANGMYMDAVTLVVSGAISGLGNLGRISNPGNLGKVTL